MLCIPLVYLYIGPSGDEVCMCTEGAGVPTATVLCMHFHSKWARACTCNVDDVLRRHMHTIYIQFHQRLIGQSVAKTKKRLAGLQ